MRAVAIIAGVLVVLDGWHAILPILTLGIVALASTLPGQIKAK